MTSEIQDHYRTLGVPRDADARDIRQAYLRQMREVHPDLHPGDSRAASQLNESYHVLVDPQSRAAYDYELRLMAVRTVTGPHKGSTYNSGHMPHHVHPRPIVPREMRPGAFDPDRREPLHISWLVALFAALLTVLLYGLFQNGA